MKNERCTIQAAARLDAAVGALYQTLMARGLLGNDAQISHDYAGLCAEAALLRGDTSEQAYWEARQAQLKQRLANSIAKAAYRQDQRTWPAIKAGVSPGT